MCQQEELYILKLNFIEPLIHRYFTLWDVVYIESLSNNKIKITVTQNLGISLVNLKIRLFIRINQNIAFLHELMELVQSVEKDKFPVCE